MRGEEGGSVSDERKRALQELAGEALRHLEWLRDAGVREVPLAPPPAPVAARRAAAAPAPRPPAPAQAPAQATPPAPAPAPARAYSLDDKGCGSPSLLAVRQELGECTRCKLAGGRTNLVFGTGNPEAELVFVGEGPGADEDLQGEPFVGKAGQLLTRMIEAMGYRREQVYIANVVKCRPPGNRNPEPDEIEPCEPFLRRQLEAVGPKVIVALGKFAAQTLLRSTVPITRLRGTWSTYQGVRLMPTFHPAYLLRSPEEKKKAWADLQLVMAELGKAPPAR
jgi:uracil-DNA glycosylase family 4